MRGFLIVVVGSLGLALQNVLLRVIFSESSILGQGSWGGFLAPTLSHSLLVLHLRSILILPAVILLSYRLYPTTTQALTQLLQPERRPTLRLALMSSSFLYLAMALLFVAIASIPAGVATVLFFMHPVITGLLTWVVFGSRPSRLRLAVTVGVMLGSLLVVPSFAGSATASLGLGVGAALGASVAYSLQGVQAQICFRHIHPVPFTLINFAIMAFWSTLSLFFIQIEVPPEQWGILWGLSVIAAALTLLGQLCYNVGIHLVRAASMSIVAVSNPVLTVALAWLLLQESLQGRQIFGMVLVVASIVALGQEQARKPKTSAI
ncbi:EamA family transporter [Leptolyngbya sp. BL0902]|uniref:DMT family transporter n=1 Tax=Leptolyngbya sp. BL0902 TaxID=1115757 RepID=UPI0018E87B96|nr:DMT family transporter [Leptolyngbya sp. BL0902]QQE67041.1 EamA family transporter [Leptolyngbya sp. BL0902]